MPAKILESIRQRVIQRRLEGKTFSEISKEFGISHGYAVDAFNQWLQDLDTVTPEAIMELVKVLKDLNVKPIECAKGIQIRATIKKYGIKEEDDVESFLLAVINQLILAGVSPNDVADSIQEMLKLSEKARAPIWTVLENATNVLREQEQIKANIANLKTQQEQARTETNKALEDRHLVKQNIENYVRGRTSTL